MSPNIDEEEILKLNYREKNIGGIKKKKTEQITNNAKCFYSHIIGVSEELERENIAEELFEENMAKIFSKIISYEIAELIGSEKHKKSKK